MDWHTKQDKQISESVSAIGEVLNLPSAARRLWGMSDSLLEEKHFLNIASIRGKDSHFRLLDVGCGRGGLLNKIADYFPNSICVGLEPNEASLIEAQQRKRENIEFINAQFDQCHNIGLFDVVICSEVFEHVADNKGLLDGLAGFTKPGGRLSISTPSGWMYRTPRIYNAYKILIDPRRFYRLYITPEKNWDEALSIHPAILPSKLKRMVERRGFKLRVRQASLWWLWEQGPLFRSVSQLEKWGWQGAGIYLYHLISFLEALMNLIPPLRVLETRCVMMFEKKHDV